MIGSIDSKSMMDDEIDVMLSEIQQHVDVHRSAHAARLACMIILVYYVLVVCALARMCMEHRDTSQCTGWDVMMVLHTTLCVSFLQAV